MPPFTPVQLVQGLKEKPDALLVIYDRLYLASGANLSVYSVPPNRDKADLVTTKKAIFRKPADEIVYIQEINSIAVLCDRTVTLWDLPNLRVPTVLSQARYAQSLAAQTCLVDLTSMSSGKGKGKQSATMATKPGGEDFVPVTTLVIGCRKKVVVMTWQGGKPNASRDLNLPHSPRLILFTSSDNSDVVHLHISPTDFLILQIPKSLSKPLVYTDALPINLPLPSEKTPVMAGTMGGMGALSGIGGYMGKGLGALSGKAGPGIVGTGLRNGQLLVMRENQGVFVSPDGKQARTDTIDWPNPPEDVSFSNPYIVSTIAPGAGGGDLQVRLYPTLSVQQLVRFPIAKSGPANSLSAEAGHSTLRLLSVAATPINTQATAADRPLAMYCVSTPMEKVQALQDGTSVWMLRPATWQNQLAELIREGRFQDGLSLLDSIPDSPNIDKAKNDKLLRTLDALATFGKQQWEKAMDSFVQLDITPARVVALFPADTVAGRLHLPQHDWVEAFGGPHDGHLEAQDLVEQPEQKSEKGGLLKGLPHLTRRGSNESQRPASISSAARIESSHDSVVEYEIVPPAALESLVHYLADRRQKLTGAVNSLTKPLPAIDSLPPLKSIPIADLLNYPSVPVNELSPEQLVRVLQIVYTALLKVYLAIRPVLVGSLCRIENWCEVEEVEELLKERKKYGDLIDLYQGKKMHEKALNLLRELSKDEDDPLDKYGPTVRYLQKLGPINLGLILSHSRWLFASAPSMAIQVFTADEAEAEALPRHEVMRFLEEVDRDSCVVYLEHVTGALGEAGPEFHDKLAEMYLDAARQETKRSGEDGSTADCDRLQRFLADSSQYHPDRLLGRLQGEELPKARAILLGRLGNHEAALQIYVNRLQSYREAEEYCTRVYASKTPEATGIFLVLLRLYLRPAGTVPPLLAPALSLLTTQGLRIDTSAAIDLLPPLVSMQDLQAFLIKNLRSGLEGQRERSVSKNLWKTRKEEVDWVAMEVEEKRVRITDIRICPQCHKRLGRSVIAVHTPRGEVTHYQCKDAFATRLAAARS